MYRKKPPTIQERVAEYLVAGGLINPELMDHDKVRDLLIDADKKLTERELELMRVYALPDLEWIKARSVILQRLAAISRITDNEAIRDICKAIVTDMDKATIYVKRLEQNRAASNSNSQLPSGQSTD